MVTETAQAAASTGVLGTLGVDWKLLLAQLVNFGVVMFVMWRWVYKPLVAMLDERAKKIEQGLKDAEDAAAAKTSAEAEKTRLIDEARKSGKTVVEDLRSAAEKERDEMILKAKQEVEKVISQGKAQLKNEKELMMAEVRAEASQLVVAAVERIIGERLDPKKDEKLIRESLKEASVDL